MPSPKTTATPLTFYGFTGLRVITNARIGLLARVLMMDQGRWLFAAVTTLTFASFNAGSLALADSPAPPRSYKEVAPGGEYVFVMVVPGPHEDDLRLWSDSMGELPRGAARGGLYRHDGSTEALWTVDWYAHGVEIASDGIHLIRHGPWAGSISEEAISFFANGQLLRTYLIQELVDYPKMLPRSVSHFRWRGNVRFDDAQMECAITTMDGNRFVFDVRTGEIVSRFRLGRTVLWVLGFVVFGLAVWFIRRRRVHIACRSYPRS